MEDGCRTDGEGKAGAAAEGEEDGLVDARGENEERGASDLFEG